jgi:F0F1-type ATP synthase membrane subunit b/b'
VEKSTHDVARATQHQEKTLLEAGNRFNAVVDQSVKGLAQNLEAIVTRYAAKLNDFFNQFWDKGESLLEAHNSAFDAILTNFNQLDAQARQHAEQVFRQANDHLRELAEEASRFLQSQTGDIYHIIEGAKKEFQGAVSRLAKENSEVLSEQIKQLDQDLQKQLKKALEDMGSHLTSLSGKFVQDYTPLTQELHRVVRIADELHRRRTKEVRHERPARS